MKILKNLGGNKERALSCFIFVTLKNLPGGIGEAVAGVLSTSADFTVRHRLLAVRDIPRSGPPDVLLDHYGVSAGKVEEAVLKLLSKKRVLGEA